METSAITPASRPRLSLAASALVAVLAACSPSDPAVQAERQWHVCESSVFDQQRLDACSAVIASAVTEPSQKAQALVHRGTLRVRLRQDARAIADFGRALRIDPGLVSAYLERGQLHFNREAFEAAVRDYEAALSLNPALSDAQLMRDAALRSLEERSLGELEWLTRELAENPLESGLWNNRCWLRAVSGEELDLALADCNEAIRLDPRSAAALDSRGLVHLKRGEYSAAVADYTAALALDPERGHYLYGRGVARLRMGEEAAGRADIAAAERAEPGIRRTYQGYGVEI
ncbi:MAG TPA: tetratricopeptide repeat protein [Vitreimonas sp.]|uniref:tetratricopeptide repeat protein n=1 Tax=Vitreimonas sp. TaxID=3069702 RepID=UPI002D4D5694|nr:tetratricopeptide repeat protein [Vitreimonas sp.]HYD88509.1 tetratricopeptide repeat protein [Vitreimonas sp.]